MRSLFLFLLLDSLGVPGNRHGDLLGFPCALVSGVFWELLKGMLGCVWFYLVRSCYFLTTAVSWASMLA